MESNDLLQQMVVYLLAAVAAVPLSKRLGLGSVIGYLVAGVVIGPFGVGLIGESESVMRFAEMGVVFLLFLIGLELNLSRLWSLRRSIFGAGSMQVLGTMVVLTALGCVYIDWRGALIGAMGLSMSSTAIGLQLLKEKKLLRTEAGEQSFSVLLFQDLAVIPMMTIIPLLAGPQPGEAGGAWTVFKQVAAVVGILAGGRYLLRPIFRYVARTELREIFTASSLLLVLAIAAFMHAVGLSMALGSFLAGVLLADSEYRHELEIDIEPFKGLLLGLFFIAVGMSIDLRWLLQNPLLVAGLVGLVIAVKILILSAVGHYYGLRGFNRRVFAIALGQGGEFAFVLFQIAVGGSLFSVEVARLLYLVVALSMVVTPFLFMWHERRCPEAAVTVRDRSLPDEFNPVILAGFGRFGQTIARVLSTLQVKTTLLDIDPNQVDLVRRFGWKAFYGDVTRLDLLEAAGIAHAKLFIVAVDNPETALQTVDLVQQHYPQVKIISRARSRTDAFRLINRGIPMARETFGSALELAEMALTTLGYPELEARRVALTFREYDYELLRTAAPHVDDEDMLMNISRRGQQELMKLFENDEKRLNPAPAPTPV